TPRRGRARAALGDVRGRRLARRLDRPGRRSAERVLDPAGAGGRAPGGRPTSAAAPRGRDRAAGCRPRRAPAAGELRCPPTAQRGREPEMAMPLKRRLLLPTPLPAAWMSQVIIHNVYVKFYTDIVGLDTRYVGWVYLFFNIWNVLNDPVFGVLLDKMRYRPGKGKFLLVMRVTIPFLLLGLALMAWTPSSWPQAAIFAVFLGELFLFDVAATLYLISATSYVYLAAPTREDRIDVEVARAWIGNL